MVQRYMDLKDRVCGKYSIPLESNQGFWSQIKVLELCLCPLLHFFQTYLVFKQGNKVKYTKPSITKRQQSILMGL